MSDERLDALARSTLASPPITSTAVDAIRERAARRRRRQQFSLVVGGVVVVVLVAAAIGVRAAGNRSPGVRVEPQPTTTTSSVPSDETAQISVPLSVPNTPVAVGNGRVWVRARGVEVFDPTTLHEVGRVPVELGVLEIATSPDGVWVLSGRDYDQDTTKNPPFHLERIDPLTLRVTFSTNLPFSVGYHSSWHLRMAAVPGTLWIAYGPTVLRIDASTDAVETISLVGSYAGAIAADESGLWIVSNGSGPGRAIGPVIHVDAATDRVTTIPHFPVGFYWSVATTDGAAWVIASTGNGVGLNLFRIDEVTRAVTSTRVLGVALVSGDGQLWVQRIDPSGHSLNYHDLVGQIDTATGRITRSVRINIGEEPNSSADGYTAPPFAVVDGYLWSAYDGLQRTATTTASTTPSAQSNSGCASMTFKSPRWPKSATLPSVEAADAPATARRFVSTELGIADVAVGRLKITKSGCTVHVRAGTLQGEVSFIAFADQYVVGGFSLGQTSGLSMQVTGRHLDATYDPQCRTCASWEMHVRYGDMLTEVGPARSSHLTADFSLDPSQAGGVAGGYVAGGYVFVDRLADGTIRNANALAAPLGNFGLS